MKQNTAIGMKIKKMSSFKINIVQIKEGETIDKPQNANLYHLKSK